MTLMLSLSALLLLIIKLMLSPVFIEIVLRIVQLNVAHPLKAYFPQQRIGAQVIG